MRADLKITTISEWGDTLYDPLKVHLGWIVSVSDVELVIQWKNGQKEEVRKYRTEVLSDAKKLISQCVIDFEGTIYVILESDCSQTQIGRELISKQAVFNDLISKIYKLFVAKGFIHFKTPSLVEAPGIDAFVEFMRVQGSRTSKSWFLPTSPEIELKKTMNELGAQDIFEIKTVYRDDDSSENHTQEFEMLEWYRPLSDKWQLLDDVLDIMNISLNLEKTSLLKKSVAGVFYETVGFRLTPATAIDELKVLCQELGIEFHHSDDWDDLFNRIFIEVVEPQLKKEPLLVLYNYPPTQSSVARLTDLGWADRMELYIFGVEVANFYQEETSALNIKDYVNQQVSKRNDLNRTPLSVDKGFLNLQQKKILPCAGAALGINRLYVGLSQLKKL